MEAFPDGQTLMTNEPERGSGQRGQSSSKVWRGLIMRSLASSSAPSLHPHRATRSRQTRVTHGTAAWRSSRRAQLRSHRPPGPTASRERALEWTGRNWRTSHPRSGRRGPIRYTLADVLRSRVYEIDTAGTGVNCHRDGGSPAHPVKRCQANRPRVRRMRGPVWTEDPSPE
jgi:hypothetical protein